MRWPPAPRRDRLPADAGSDDVAVIASCEAFIGSSLHGSIVAAAFDRTWLMLDMVEQAKRRGVAALFDAEDRVVPDVAGIADAFRAAAAQGSPAPRVAQLHERIDGAFDRLAELAISAPTRAAGARRGGHHGRPAPARRGRARRGRAVAFADERDRRLLYEREVADVMARTAKIEAWNLELDAGNVERDRPDRGVGRGRPGAPGPAQHVGFGTGRASAPGRALRRRRGSP
jgi:hypothetical protein